MAIFQPKFQWLALPFISLAFHMHCGFKVIGRENIPEGGCVICPNHSDVIDPPLVAACIGNKHRIRVMAKKELFEKKNFGNLITWLGAFPVDRNRADIKAIKPPFKLCEMAINYLSFLKVLVMLMKVKQKKELLCLLLKLRLLLYLFMYPKKRAFAHMHMWFLVSLFILIHHLKIIMQFQMIS